MSNEGLMMIPDYTEFGLKYKESGRAVPVKRYIITSQTPKAGTLAWPGTVIEVVIEDRDAIAIDTFSGLEPKFAEKYRVVGDFHADLIKAGGGLKDIVTGNPKYPPSSPVEREKADLFIKETFGPEVDNEKVYNDMSFLANM